MAEHTIALLMCVSKNISLTDHLLKYTDQLTGVHYQDDGGKRAETMSEWSMDPTAPFALYGGGPEMYSKTFGQIGFGMIGREVAKRADALGMKVLIYDPFVEQSGMDFVHGTKADLETVMKESDFVSVNCNVTPDTVGLVSRELIALMKPTAYFVTRCVSGGADSGRGQVPVAQECGPDAASGRFREGYRRTSDRYYPARRESISGW